MKRKIYDTMLAWKQEDQGRSALLIDGARRVGKSYIAEAFGKAEYQSYILVDFNRASKDVLVQLDTMEDIVTSSSPVLNGIFSIYDIDITICKRIKTA